MPQHEGFVGLSLEIFIVCKAKKAKHAKFDPSPDSKQNFQDNHHNLVMTKGITFIIGCGLVVILKRGE